MGSARENAIRHINTPRIKIFSPNESSEDCPIPLKYVNVWRQTYTNSCLEHERSIFDVWVSDDTDNAELSELWVGATKFWIWELRP